MRTLPVSGDRLPEAPTAPAIAEESKATERRAILVVEDNDEVADTVCAMLEDLGHQPRRARSADEALGMLERDGHYDMVFSDIVMPGGKSGIELANELETRAPHLPVLLTTGYSGGPTVEVRRPLLRKPYQIAELQEAIASMPLRQSG